MAAAQSPNFWIVKYTRDDLVDILSPQIKNLHPGGIVKWRWKQQQPSIGDYVFILQAGARPEDHPRDQSWRGIVGYGIVVNEPVTPGFTITASGTPVETLAYFPYEVLPDYLFWHDHRIASADVIYGQMGVNFPIDRDVAVGLVDEIDAPEDGIQRANVYEHPNLNALLEDRHGFDAVTRTIDKSRAWVDRDAAIALQLARAFSGASSSRSGELTWTHLFFGVLLQGKNLRKNTRKDVATLCLYHLASPNDDDAELDALWESTRLPISKLKRSDAVAMEKMSPSAEEAIRQAKAISGDGLISVEAMLAALINTHRNDNVYKDVFKTDRDGLIERLYEQAVQNDRAEELRQFLTWVKRTNLADGPIIPSPEDNFSASDAGPKAVLREARNDRSSTPTPEGTFSVSDAGPETAVTTALDAKYPVWQIPNAQNDSADREQDLLDVEEEAKAFARLIASTSFEPPLAIGVFGPWGSGKTFFMNQIEKAIRKLVQHKVNGVEGQATQDTPSFHDKIVRIPFNAWHYMEANVWASLVDVIFKDLDAWLRDKNGGSNKGEDIDALFDSLTTAQEEQLNAIEALAEKVKALESARKDLSDVEQNTKDYWKSVLDELKSAKLSNKHVKRAINTLGLQTLSDEALNLQNAISEARKTASNADLLIRSLRSRISSPLNLASLAAVVLLGPFLIGWLINFAEKQQFFVLSSDFNLDETITTIAGLAASATAWLGAVTARASKGVTALRTLQEKFNAIDEKKKTPLAKLETNIDDAKSIIIQSEEAVAKAQTRLMEHTSAGRIAAFIRDRAESDVYSKHLGIIDTIRRDFEQLSALVENSKTKDDESEILELHKKHVAAQIDAIKARYDLDNATYATVNNALDKLNETNKTGIKLGTTFDRIVLYIDDLDRCPPNKVYEVLQALHLFLTFPLFVVVVGVDTRWMETSLKKELGNLVDGTSGANPKDYLEKIFQIPYWTRRMEGRIARKFVKNIMPNSQDDGVQTDYGKKGETDDDQTPTPLAPVPTEDATPENSTEPPSIPPTQPSYEEPDDDQPDDLAVEIEEEDDPAEAQILTRPVEITKTERAILEEFAPFAGRSPRKLLRFVNVYGLIKSVDNKDGSPLIDYNDDELGCRALIAQLALATGSPEAAIHHFDLIETSDDYFVYFDVTGSENPEREPPLRLAPDFAELIWEPLRLVIPPQEKSDFSRSGLYEKLKSTAPIARRYTFASSDAVQASDAEGT